MNDVASEREWLEYRIRCNESYIREYEKLIESAERQIEQEHQARGKDTKVAKERIEHLTKSFIPWQQDGIQDSRECIERYRARLDALNFVEKDGQLELVF
ncbi:hypothetical protein [Paenibacillus campinasensis]|uniref:Uncharacterized protein n=1 Tax=Paenibacillus campinasensis TaxID=66347 RepID=A0A268ELH0_9BACL|nr:hypothetical protein [Paenibacillus campinasensis]PAD73954.1 hypothetical protein CHH67_19160 [Paenibacillus campinasensis]